jgi:hypothetical protein
MKALEQWCDMAKESELAPFLRLAKSFRKGADKDCGILQASHHVWEDRGLQQPCLKSGTSGVRHHQPCLRLAQVSTAFHQANLTEGLK